MIEFFHPCTPPKATAQQRRHTRRGKTYMPAHVRLAQARLRAICELHAPPEPLAGPVRVFVGWTWPGKALAAKITRPDLDNLLKLMLDAMTAAGYWQDDAQVCFLEAGKWTGPVPGIAVRVEGCR